MAEKSRDIRETVTRILIAPLLILAGLVALSIFAVYYPFFLGYRQWLKFRYWEKHGKHGRFVLFIYSDSPNWKNYLEEYIIPGIEPHVVILNWSKRREWERTNPFEARIFNHWAGEKEFNPMALVFSPTGEVKEVRFWQAFRDFKHGHEESLKKAENLLYTEVERIVAEMR
ncbi:MAG: hypothetical protein AAB288_04905 [Acidobacteriota bacterium]